MFVAYVNFVGKLEASIEQRDCVNRNASTSTRADTFGEAKERDGKAGALRRRRAKNLLFPRATSNE